MASSELSVVRAGVQKRSRNTRGCPIAYWRKFCCTCTNPVILMILHSDLNLCRSPLKRCTKITARSQLIQPDGYPQGYPRFPQGYAGLRRVAFFNTLLAI